ncbi:hypothetical protein NDS46_30250 (plasmid) [Paenibacillus thiaminolyticus]|nr:hypothetical protein [Paenibacillus thiaminolyticus]WCF11630.1 hypothetical protein NDS46_30250 [Paenibacillus thiaminolyticus]
MKTFEARFEELTASQLQDAFKDYEEWRETGILQDGWLRVIYDQFR